MFDKQGKWHMQRVCVGVCPITGELSLFTKRMFVMEVPKYATGGLTEWCKERGFELVQSHEATWNSDTP
jgi:hypothetical protein